MSTSLTSNYSLYTNAALVNTGVLNRSADLCGIVVEDWTHFIKTVYDILHK